jgi:hypothetical protein
MALRYNGTRPRPCGTPALARGQALRYNGTRLQPGEAQPAQPSEPARAAVLLGLAGSGGSGGSGGVRPTAAAAALTTAGGVRSAAATAAAGGGGIGVGIGAAGGHRNLERLGRGQHLRAPRPLAPPSSLSVSELLDGAVGANHAVGVRWMTR